MLMKNLATSRRIAGSLTTKLALFGLASCFVLALPAVADVLVMTDGSRVETKGAWEVKGRQVVFTLPNGTLSAVRASEVDLEASRAATDAANRPPEAESETADTADDKLPEPVRVLTNDDIGAGPSDTGDDDSSEDSDTPSSSDGVVVAEWSYDPAGIDPVYELTGRLENSTGRVVEGIQLYVDFIATDGGTPRPDVHFLREARVIQTRLEPNESTDFRYGISVRDLEYSKAAEQFESPRVTFDVQYRTVGNAIQDDDADGDDEDIGASSEDLAESDDDIRP